MSRRTIAVLVPGVIAAVSLSACGTREIDSKKASNLVRSGLHKAGLKDSEIKKIDCPSGVKVKKGKTYACVATASDGSKLQVVFRMDDNKGKVHVIQAKQLK